DSYFGRFIQSMAEMAGLMGADVIISGLQDAVVETLVELGMTLPNIHAVLDLDDALALSRAEQPSTGFRTNNGLLGDTSASLNGFFDDSAFTDITAEWIPFANLTEV
ncbi:MAG: hypothetical protein JW953_10740, partial [Anaerolineae bacterium]|nr:hypothetical protein [Anaerolineae bacterium]